jgi:hypothetical protein
LTPKLEKKSLLQWKLAFIGGNPLPERKIKSNLDIRHGENVGIGMVENAGDHCRVTAARLNLQILPLVIY